MKKPNYLWNGNGILSVIEEKKKNNQRSTVRMNKTSALSLSKYAKTGRLTG